jgi:hypothetical protein
MVNRFFLSVPSGVGQEFARLAVKILRIADLAAGNENYGSGLLQNFRGRSKC